MRKFERVTSRIIPLALDNINTDQIIPARFLTRTALDGWGNYLFADWKINADFVLDQARLAGAGILLGGWNFGCGSSREHAAWSLRDFGIRAIVAPSFADIFRENAIKNGLLPATLEPRHYDELIAELSANGDQMWTVDLPAQLLMAGKKAFPFEIDRFSKTCLMRGLDELGYILDHDFAINAHEVFTRM